MKELKSIDEFRNRIICSVSHELNTPLNCSINLLNIALENESIS